MGLNIEEVNVELIRQCIDCNYTTPNIIDIRRHVTNHSKSTNRRVWICPDCIKIYTSKFYLDNHILKAHYDTGLKYVTIPFYQCDTCDFRDIRTAVIVNHIENKLLQFDFECYHCRKIFKCKKDLLTHFNRHHKPPSNCYQCSKCLYATNYKKEYDFHVLRTPSCYVKNLKYVTRCQSITC